MNLPNKLSIMRIVLVPILMFFYMATFIPFGKIIAVVLFIIAAFTDLFDGKIARKRDQITDLGKLLDPLADKMLYTCSLFLIVADGTLMAPWGVIALFVTFARDSVVNGIRQIAASKGVVVAAAKSGKIKSIFIYIYIPLFMFIAQGLFVGTGYYACDVINQVLVITAYVIMAIATLATAYSCYDYCMINKDIILAPKQAENKEATSQEEATIETPAEDTPKVEEQTVESESTDEATVESEVESKSEEDK